MLSIPVCVEPTRWQKSSSPRLVSRNELYSHIWDCGAAGGGRGACVDAALGRRFWRSQPVPGS
jgi:hypothetical protein